ncbi:hypothetical protein [Streptosporangium sp. NPDC051022]|uniref:hypothetical protein n=1 Tax=Streptosporangium sp. NPDC051022 TaxID=3155752 RepID=UPI0034366D62
MLSVVPGPHDPRSREWPADDGVHGDGTYEGRSRRHQDSPPTIQHFPPGPQDDSPRGLPLASPWMLPPFAAPTPDDDEPPRARPEGLGGERRRAHTQPYASPTGLPQTDPVARAAPFDPSGPAPEDTEAGQGRRRRTTDRPDLLVASGAPRGPEDAGGADRPGGSREPDDGDYGDLLGPSRGSGDGHADPLGPSGGRGDFSDTSGRSGDGGYGDLLWPPYGSEEAGRGDSPGEARSSGDGDYGDLLGVTYDSGTDGRDAGGDSGGGHGRDDGRDDGHGAPYGTGDTGHAEPPGAPPEPGGRRRRNRPDLLVASGPPRRPADPDPLDGPDTPVTAVPHGAEEPYPAENDGPSGTAGDDPRAGQPVPETREPESGELAVPEADDDFEPVRRVGRPPGGRPARPDLLVAEGPPGRRGANGGRHHRPATAPSALRRSSPTRRGRRRGLVVPAVMIAVLAAAVGGGVVLWGWTNGSFTTGLQLVGDEVGSGDADFVSPSNAVGNGSSQVLNAVASAGSLMVAVGSDTTSPVPRPLFLISPDGGATWQLGKVTGSAGYGNGPTTVGRVAGGDGLWLAAGNDLLGSGRGLWTSEDGYTWAAVDPGKLGAFTAGDKIMDLARTSSGFVAVGTAVLQNGAVGAVAWVSPDGQSWDRVDSGKIGAPDKVRGLKAVVAKGDAVVALGDPAQGQSSAVVMRSADGGRTWTRAGAAPAGVIPEAGALATASDGFVLVPTQQRNDKGGVDVYCSPEGVDWTRCGTITGLARDGSGVKRLASSGAGVAAVAESGFERYAVYTSEDGRDWRKTTDLGEVPGSLRALAISDDGTLVVGGDERAADVDNRLVLITAPRGGQATPVALDRIDGLARAARDTARVAAAGGGFVAVGAVSGDAGIWTSADGQSWKAAGPAQVLGGPRRQALSDVAQGRRGWLAVGGTMTDASSTGPLLVTSADGRTWRRIPVTGPLAPAAEHDFLAPHAVAAGPSGYVLAGEDRGPSTTVPVLWFSSDLKRYTRAAKLPAGGGGVRLYDVSATSSGYVAVGGMGTAERETGVVWVSADGVNWVARKPVLPPGATSAGLRHVVQHGTTIVAAGTATTGDGLRAFGAVSGDNGSSWEFSWLPADQAAAVYDLAATAEGVVAVGWQGTPGEGDSVAWTSEDGLKWQPHAPTQGNLSGDGAQWLGAVTVSGDRVVALGRSTTYDSDHLTLWRSTLTASR